MTERREYDDQTKGAVMAALLTGQSINYVAKAYKIPRGTVASWARTLQRDHAVSPQRKERIGDLIIDNLEAALETTKAMLDVVKDPAWLREQPAQEIAILYGVISDKTYRVLEALPDETDQGDGQGDGSG